MKIIRNIYNDIHPGYPIETIAPISNILFIDIETTGLSKERSHLYLIGCGFFETDGYHTVQWFADSLSEESMIITSFSDYINGRFDFLIHYNGNRFDMPFLRYRAMLHNLTDPLLHLKSLDIYAYVKPLKKLLNLPSLKQRCVEQFLNIYSDDPFTGRELISVYHSYTKSPSDEMLNRLVFHNTEDLKGMAYILPILHYASLKDIRFKYISHTTHVFRDYHEKEQYELIVNYEHDADIPVSFNTGNGPVRLAMRADNTALLRIPVIKTELRKYYDDYKNYYYLPFEDCCIHRSAAEGVDKSRRENAKKETCYIKRSGLFIPCILPDRSLTFKSDLKSKELFIPYTEETAENLMTEIGIHLINYIF